MPRCSRPSLPPRHLSLQSLSQPSSTASRAAARDAADRYVVRHVHLAEAAAADGLAGDPEERAPRAGQADLGSSAARVGRGRVQELRAGARLEEREVVGPHRRVADLGELALVREAPARRRDGAARRGARPRGRPICAGPFAAPTW